MDPVIVGLDKWKLITGLILPILQMKCKNQIMTIEQAQEQVDYWIKTVGVRYFSELTNMAILTEEVGELARIMARTYGEQSWKASEQKKDMADEMADILWVLICLANQTGVDLTEAMRRNFEKKNNRDGQRHQANDKLR
jgi:NTP pyrophosphatase (non-canonical NTP hydrolase)